MESQMIGRAPRTPSRTHYGMIILSAVAMICLTETQIATAENTPERTLTLPREFQRRSLTRVLSAELAEQLSTTIERVYNVNLSDEERLAAADHVRDLLGNAELSNFRSSVNRRVDLISAGIHAQQNKSLLNGSNIILGEKFRSVLSKLSLFCKIKRSIIFIFSFSNSVTFLISKLIYKESHSIEAKIFFVFFSTIFSFKCNLFLS